MAAAQHRSLDIRTRILIYNRYQSGSLPFSLAAWLTFIGKPGTGKTHLSTAIGVKAVLQVYTVLFTTLSDMLDDLLMSRAESVNDDRSLQRVKTDASTIETLAGPTAAFHVHNGWIYYISMESNTYSFWLSRMNNDGSNKETLKAEGIFVFVNW